MLRSSDRLLFAIAVCACSTGCYSPGLYQTPRTLAPRSFVLALAAEPAVLLRSRDTGPTLELVKFPSVTAHARLGLTDRVELSGSVGMLMPVHGALMAKLHVVRHPLFDFALLPRFAVAGVSRAPVFYSNCTGDYCDSRTHLEPSVSAMFGLNVLDDATLVLAPGIGKSIAPHGRMMYRVSMGLQLRLSALLMIHPEVTYVYEPLGFASNFGGFFGGIAIGIRGADGYPNSSADAGKPVTQ